MRRPSLRLLGRPPLRRPPDGSPGSSHATNTSAACRPIRARIACASGWRPSASRSEAKIAVAVVAQEAQRVPSEPTPVLGSHGWMAGGCHPVPFRMPVTALPASYSRQMSRKP